MIARLLHHLPPSARWLSGLVVLTALALPAAASANEVSISGSMEGSIQISQGDFVAGGYIFNFQGSHPAATVQVANASVVFVGKCSNGSSDNTLTVPLSPGPYQVAANDNSSIPTGDESSPASFQGSVTAHPCGGSGTLDASKGATFSGDLQSTVTANTIQIKFHYRDPAAKGKGNFDCSSPSSGSLGADVCGASWSSTIAPQPDEMPVTPGLTTTASAGGAIGTAVHDTAHLTGGNNPGGSITFKLYAAGDTTCAGAPINGSPTVTVNGNGNYDSPAFTPTSAGTYNWRAFYSGDANNNPVSTPCGDNNETVTITPAGPAITTNASAGGAVGTSIHDVAHLTGTTSGAGGSITFTLYKASDTMCATPVFTSPTPVPVNGSGPYTGPSFTPTQAGSYQWVAAYSGDTNNNAVASQCNDSAEGVTITPTGPAISTNASAGGPVGTAVHDVAHLAGTTNTAGGTITFTLYTAADTSCSTALFTSAAVPVHGPGPYTSPSFTPTNAGSYQWLAVYSGDANNAAVASQCNDSNEGVTITPFSPGITTNASSGGPVGTAVFDVAHLTGATASAGGGIVFRLYTAADTSCASPLFTSPAVPVSGPGTYTSPSFTPTGPGSYQWVAAYSGDTNNSAVTSACNDANEGVTITPPPIAPPLTPGISVIKYQRIDGTTAPFTRDVLTVNPGQKIDYEMVVSNTGQLPLALSFSDPHCDPGSITGPTGDLNPDGTLKPGGQAMFFCFHIAQAGDAPTFTNTVTVSGTPPSGPPVGPVSSSVVANIPAGGVSPSCVAGTVALRGAVGCTRKTFRAVIQAAPNSIKSVVFRLDGKVIRTETHVGSGNQWALTITPSRLRFGGHTLTATVTLVCNKVKRTATLHFRHCKPPAPRFTG